jgi:hypothetical protein
MQNMKNELMLNKIVANEFVALFKEVRHQGGCVIFFACKIKNLVSDSYTAHLAVAKQSLEDIYQLSQQNFIMAIDDFEVLATSGKQISAEEFLGPYFDYDLKKPLVRGVENNSTLNSYFLYDDEEIVKNAIAIDQRLEDYKLKYPNSSNGFTYAFLEPPYGFGRNKTIQDKGSLFLSVIEQLFSDIDKIEVYTWSTDTGSYFNAGKEWWGTFFYTIYNPIKDMYIGVLASTSD